MQYIPRENPGEGFGVAFLPILEVPGQAAVKDINFPSSHSLETELCSALRDAVWASAIPAGDYQAKWDEGSCPAVTGSISHQWPNPGKEIRKKTTSNTGNNHFRQSHCLKLIKLSPG